MGSEILYFIFGIGFSILIYAVVIILRKINLKSNKVQKIDKNLDQTKDEFISFVSHELRSPMGAVKGLASMMLKGDYGPIPDRFRQPLTNVYVSAERQIRMINDILNISRFQSGRIRYTLLNFSFEKVTSEVIETLQPLAKQRRITLTLNSDGKTQVQGDDIWVRQILENIIGNAVKFTEEGGVTVSYKEEGDMAFVIVEDTGVGIDPYNQKKLFIKFQQVGGSLLQKTIGTGLGLYISREVARQMGGDVRLEKSEVGKGSTFVLGLPKSGSALAIETRLRLEKEMLLTLNNNVGKEK